MANSVDPDQLASKKPTDLDLHCLQRQSTSGFSMTRVNSLGTRSLDEEILMHFINRGERRIFIQISWLKIIVFLLSDRRQI